MARKAVAPGERYLVQLKEGILRQLRIIVVVCARNQAAATEAPKVGSGREPVARPSKLWILRGADPRRI